MRSVVCHIKSEADQPPYALYTERNKAPLLISVSKDFHRIFCIHTLLLWPLLGPFHPRSEPACSADSYWGIVDQGLSASLLIRVGSFSIVNFSECTRACCYLASESSARQKSDRIRTCSSTCNDFKDMPYPFRQ